MRACGVDLVSISIDQDLGVRIDISMYILVYLKTLSTAMEGETVCEHAAANHRY